MAIASLFAVYLVGAAVVLLWKFKRFLTFSERFILAPLWPVILLGYVLVVTMAGVAVGMSLLFSPDQTKIRLKRYAAWATFRPF